MSDEWAGVDWGNGIMGQRIKELEDQLVAAEAELVKCNQQYEALMVSSRKTNNHYKQQADRLAQALEEAARACEAPKPASHRVLAEHCRAALREWRG